MTSEPQLKPYQEKIITLLLKQETLLASLYQTFAQKFPEHEEFWSQLAREEEKHAGWLEQLRAATKKKVVLFNEGRIKTYTMETFVQGMGEHVQIRILASVDEMGDGAAEIRIVMLIDQVADRAGVQAGLEDLGHHHREIRAAAAVYHHGLSISGYKIGIAV